jgi:glycosyltransferase involved in cell wall biosynthesis
MSTIGAARIAFYAPMKAPTHPVPSGDRRVARLLMEALDAPGHTVTLASSFRSYDSGANRRRQAALKGAGQREAKRLIEGYRAAPVALRPTHWFTYHLYHKAPDWLGPRVSEALAIPYLIAEASHGAKQATGPYADGHAAAAQAIARAAAIFSFTPEDEAGIAPLITAPGRLHRLAPFLDPGPYDTARAARASHRQALAATLGLDPALPWLLAVAMMRAGDKLASYRRLGRALGLIARPRFQLIVVGDGAARAAVEEALAPIGPEAVRYAGAREAAALPAFYAAADLFVWPAVNEAYGMVLLEAAATGLPVIAGRERGVPEIVAHGETGVLVENRDPSDFAEAVVTLLEDDALRQRLGLAATARVRTRHSLASASAALDRVLRALGTP